MATIGARYGIPWKLIWDSPANETLRSRRDDPNVLAPGDIVTIPPPICRKAQGATGTIHRFVVKREKIKLFVRLTGHHEPLTNEPYRLEYDDEQVDGTTASDGIIEAEIEASQSAVRLVLPRRMQSYDLELGQLDPVTRISGAQTRLLNLGLYTGKSHGTLDQATRLALESFQRIQKIAVTGQLDQRTQQELGKVYGF